MSIGAILTLGLGSFGGVNQLPTLGYTSSSAPPPTPPAAAPMIVAGGGGGSLSFNFPRVSKVYHDNLYNEQEDIEIALMACLAIRTLH